MLKVSGIAPMSASVTSGSPVLPSQPSRLSAATTTAVGKVSANVLPSRLGPSVSDQSLNSGFGKGKPGINRLDDQKYLFIGYRIGNFPNLLYTTPSGD